MKTLKFTLFIAFILQATFTIQAQEIIIAATSGNLDKVKELLEAEPQQVNVKDADGRTPLHWACRGVHFEVVKYLADKGADVNVKDNNGTAPLHSLAVRGHIEAIELLIRKGADVNIGDMAGNTPIHWASRRGHFEIVNMLLENGSAIDPLDEYGRTPLHYVARTSGNYEIGKLLIEKGAEINIKCAEGETPIGYAVYHGKKEIVSLLIDMGAYIPLEGEEGNTLLHKAASSGSLELVKYMMSHNIDIETKNSDGGTFLHSSCSGGLYEIVEILLNKGFKIDEKDRYFLTPLHYASQNGHLELVKLLVNKGVPIQSENRVGETPLIMALATGKQDVVNYLKSLGASETKKTNTTLEDKYFGQKPPGKKTEIFAPGIISYSFPEHSAPVFSDDLNEVYWVRFLVNPYRLAILRMKYDDKKWSVPEEFLSGDFPVFSTDGSKIYFQSGRPVDENDRSGKTNIWYVDINDTQNSDPHIFEPSLNIKNIGWGMSFDNDNSLYFCSSGEGSLGSSDIFVMKYDNGKYKEPENMGNSINTEFMESQPFISPDGSYLIFNRLSNSENSIGGDDLYITFKMENGEWGEAINMGASVNTSDNDFGAKISPDGKYLLFSSKGDVYWVSAKIIEDLKPAELK